MNWDSAINKHFKNKPSKMNFDLLMEMVEEVMSGDVTLLSEGKGTELGEKTKKSIMDLLPKFEISEAWGQLDTDARQEFEKYMNNIKGNSLPQKLAYIRGFTNRHDPSKYQVHEILSNLMFLDLLSTVVNNFSPSGAGFLFEAFMAGLLKGTQAVEKVEGVLQIEDLLDAEGVPFSLKLLTSTTAIKGSIRNLVSFLAKHPRGSEGIDYLAVYKFGKGKTKVLSFYSFKIDYTNIYYWLSDSLEGFGSIKLKEGYRTGGERWQTTEKDRIEQERVLNLVKASYGGQKGYAKQLEMMTSEEGVEGANLLKQHGKEQGVLAAEDEQWLDLSAEEILNLGGFVASPEASDEEKERQQQAQAWLKDLSNLRKALHKRIKSVVPASHPMGSVLKTVGFAGGEETTASIEELIALYEEDTVEWERQMLTLAGLPIKEKDLTTEEVLAEAKDAGTQFHIKSSLITSKRLPEIYKKVRYGEIITDEEAIRKIGDQYAKQLEGSVMLILEHLDVLISGITGYFVGDPKDRGSAGTSAVKSSEELSRIFSEKQEDLA
jgi:hypothetical protein